MMKKKNTLFGFLMTIFLIGEMVLVNHTLLFLFLHSFLLIAILGFQFNLIKQHKNGIGVFLYSLINLVILLLSWSLNHFNLFICSQLLSFLLALFFIIKSLVETRAHSFFSKLLKVLSVFIVLVSTMTFFIFFLLQSSSKSVDFLMKKATGITNSYQPVEKQEVKKYQKAFTQIRNIEYGSEFPNSFLDIYLTNTQTSKPTYIYLHGGGFLTGDKEAFDPLASKKDDIYFSTLLNAGYNVVSINYGLTPEQKFPTQIEQISQAITFLKSSTKEYNLNTQSFVLAGSSAGGLIIGQFSLVQTNDKYAHNVNIAPVLNASEISAVVFDSPLLDISRISEIQTPDILTEFLFKQAGKSYLTKNNEIFLRNSNPEIHAGNIIANLTKNFPPTFVADGNMSTFPDQATELSEKLTTLGVQNELFLATNDNVVHGFMASSSKATKIYNFKKLAFLEKLTD
ncbi:hypothetical protein B6S41_01670 [Enterococcus faecalis]|uniref:alpha/beta hydrolase n=1 Tax=Enterococcus faecalis TaxID=1351 RepID=UPI000A19BEEB|nr:alpha/beta hydrolase [Enterococcus faecalis]OSM25642.1 hypothetical protein B6S39_00645 [Enterococcus faecalis]OSM28841.1 hypothetical protein B6S41_01670 [Enterococcus faecalis]